VVLEGYLAKTEGVTAQGTRWEREKIGVRDTGHGGRYMVYGRKRKKAFDRIYRIDRIVW
jgi:hypothetical protein